MRLTVLSRGSFILAFLAVACSSPSPAGSPPAGGEDAGDSGNDAAPVVNATWSHVYATYFAPSSIGHCANAGCHGGGGRGGFRCAPDANGCYASLTTSILPSRGTTLVALANPTGSLLADAAESPVVWFNAGGSMPEDVPSPNDTARTEILAWLKAGAKND